MKGTCCLLREPVPVRERCGVQRMGCRPRTPSDEEERCVLLLQFFWSTLHPGPFIHHPSIPVSCLYFSAITKVPEPLTRTQCSPESKVIGRSLRQGGTKENCSCLELFKANLCIIWAPVTHWAAGVGGHEEWGSVSFILFVLF